MTETNAPADPRRAPIIVVTGIQAAGKSTVARMLAGHFERAVHIEADVLQRMIVSGSALPQQPGEPEGEPARQLRLRLAHLCMLGRSFAGAGFTAVLDDIIMGSRWTDLQDELRGYRLHVIVLAPEIDAVLARDRARPKRTLGEGWARYLDGELRRTMSGVGHWLDTTGQTPAQTVAKLVRVLDLH